MKNINVQPQTHQGSHPHPKSSHRTRWTSFCATLCVTLTLSACASLGSSPPEDQVRQRASARWQALLVNDYSKAYTYATPGYRALVSPDNYRRRQGAVLQRVSGEVFSVNCPQADKCTARVVVGVKPPLSKRYGPVITAPVDETWVLEDGQWWLAEQL